MPRGYDSQRYQLREQTKINPSHAQLQIENDRRDNENVRRGSLPNIMGHGRIQTGEEGSFSDSLGHESAPRSLRARMNNIPLFNVSRFRVQEEEPRTQGDASPERTRNNSELLSQQQHHSLTNEKDGQDEDEVAGVVGATRHFQPFTSPKIYEPLPEINIAVIGAEGVGKSTFVQKALELPGLPSSQAAEQKIPIAGNPYLVRLLELPLEDIDIADDETINWPDTIGNKMMPPLDGALALYDVTDKASVEELPEMLDAITKASLPTVLVSCKCDIPPSEREIDPNVVELNAKRAITNITTLQTSELSTDSYKQGISMLLGAIVSNNLDEQARPLSASRRRAQTSIDRPVSPRHPIQSGHIRATSDWTGGFQKDQRESQLDIPIAVPGSYDSQATSVERANTPMQNSFLFEESASTSPVSSQASFSTGAHEAQPGTGSTISSFSENGGTFDELVDRLLSQPTSKSDLKFSAIFLALYRAFAAPSQLLEAIVERFDLLEHNGCPHILKTQTQLRYVGIVEQWIAWYPGDFAFPRTKRRLRTFITRISEVRIFAQAAREINIDLEAVREDDDTQWACSDRDREASADQSRGSISSTASTLIDDASFSMEQKLSGITLNEDSALTHLPKSANQVLTLVEQAQRQAQLLQAIPRNPITKLQWRALYEQADDAVAREITRMDWIMFSAIRPRDLVRHVSLSTEQKASYKNLVHVTHMVAHFNQLASWVANYVLLRDKPKHRALMLEKFMRVARKLRELNNYNALGAIIAGVKATSVHRLVATRDLLPQSIGRDWMKLEILMSPSRSHFAYRLAWENSSTERIPYLPLHRRDLATAEEGNKTFVGDESAGRINWKKFEIMGDVIVGLQRAQGLPYKNLGGPKGNEQVRELILDVKLARDEEELYERSVQLEPPANIASGASAKFMEFFKR